MSRRARITVVLGGLVLVGILVYANTPAVRFWFSNTGTLTLYTTPIAALPPHDHAATTTQVDSILDAGHGIVVRSERFIVPEDLWVTGVETVVDNAPRSVLHHLILMSTRAPNAECPNWDTERYTVGADNLDDLTLSEPYGLFLAKGEELYLLGMAHNPAAPEGEGGTYEDVALGFRLTVEQPSSRRTSDIEFHRIALQDPPYCKDPNIYTEIDRFSVPPKTENFLKTSDTAPGVNSTRFLATKHGTILRFGAHMHGANGAKELSIYLNGELVTTVVPERTADEPWRWRSAASYTPPIRITPGDTVTLSALYDNPYDVPITDAMAQAALFFFPDPIP